ncbi:replication endonuclease [Thiothrix nivea]|uniref:Replication protein A n=1 Tax=Thiothrix nivea (strain ATCC 35100 / DSM 5205 / JP2) TaxID=870187 RepID=A0A656HL25_THINJ|nr:replication endonuclease [Thiothrix nivea]EIJ35725.1 replication protein A [Thiothrix nivea DSM 5205]
MMQPTNHPQDFGFIQEQLARIPEEFHGMVMSHYAAEYQSGEHEGAGRRDANNWLLDAAEVYALAVQKRLVAHERLALLSAKHLELFGLDATAAWAREQGARVPPYPKERAEGEPPADPHQPNSRAAVSSKLCAAEWWNWQLTRQHRQRSEQAQRNALNVCKRQYGGSPYSSDEAVENYKWSQTQLEAWKKQAYLISNEGDQFSLDSADHQHAASFIKFAEFMVRVNGMSNIAADNYIGADVIGLLPEKLTGDKGEGGSLADVCHLATLDKADPEQWIGIAFTLTTPSRYHIFSTAGGKLRRNPRYDRSTTPADARDWLQETWKLTQTAWKRATKHIESINGFGFRMDESHHDGVSHYHYAIWVQAKDAQRATQIFYDKALRGGYTDRSILAKVRAATTTEEVQKWERRQCRYGQDKDATEPGADVRRLNFKVMRSANGMVSYMVKYITKGLTGADWDDLKAGEASSQTIINIMARKSVWGLRQYAFWNAPSVMAWRELRRLEDEQDDPVLEAARLAARASDWKAYTEANGGAACPANERPIRMFRENKEDCETGSDAHNRYGEVIQQVRGLLVEGVEVRTRLKDWYLLNIGSLQKLLVQQYLRHSDTARADLPITFSDDIQAVIEQAKAQGKLTRLADHAGIVMFPSSSLPGGSPPLGLVGASSHGKSGQGQEVQP